MNHQSEIKFNQLIDLNATDNLEKYESETIQKVGLNSIYKTNVYDLTECELLNKSKRAILLHTGKLYPEHSVIVKIRKVETRSKINKFNQVSYVYAKTPTHIWITAVVNYDKSKDNATESGSITETVLAEPLD
jgi:hypothetical protein